MRLITITGLRTYMESGQIRSFDDMLQPLVNTACACGNNTGCTDVTGNCVDNHDSCTNNTNCDENDYCNENSGCTDNSGVFTHDQCKDNQGGCTDNLNNCNDNSGKCTDNNWCTNLHSAGNCCDNYTCNK